MLISAFGPFGAFKTNPSQKLVESLLAESLAGIPIKGITLPVRYNVAPEILLAEIRLRKPSAVICFGVATGSDDIRLERVAINWDESDVPDQSGDTAMGRKIDPDGPDGIFSTLPLEQMMAALDGQALPYRISNTAGTYLCNHLMYKTLWALHQEGIQIPCGFVHIPPAEEWNKDAGGPTRPFAQIRTAALRIILAVQESLSANLA